MKFAGACLLRAEMPAGVVRAPLLPPVGSFFESRSGPLDVDVTRPMTESEPLRPDARYGWFVSGSV